MGIKLGRTSKQSSDVVITKLFGIFFLIFQSGQIWGNLISSQILKPKGMRFKINILRKSVLISYNFYFQN